MNLHFDDIQPLILGSTDALLDESILSTIKANTKTIVVLDDDPTGTQTIHDVPVLTTWDTPALLAELQRGTPCFYILTNSRSLIAEAANALHEEIAANLREAFSSIKKDFIIISRSDSTLRGHYPNDVTSIATGLQISKYHTVLIPAFFEGGRYTLQDIHYVKEGDLLIPAANTSFAKDKAFGFTQSNLKNWVQEKTQNSISSNDVISFSLEAIRNNSVEELADAINQLAFNSTIIVNALNYQDLQKFAAACVLSSAPIIFRTAASFVKAIAGITTKPTLGKDKLVNHQISTGGLIIAGSYVEKTTNQLHQLERHFKGIILELNVSEIIQKNIDSHKVAETINSYLSAGTDVLVYTSRTLAVSTTEGTNLSINQTVADFITAIASTINVQPKWLIAKGGITSSDIAVKALKIKRAIVLGQALPGIPAWETGAESKFPGMSYIIFPGNVGDNNAMLDLYNNLSANN